MVETCCINADKLCVATGNIWFSKCYMMQHMFASEKYVSFCHTLPSLKINLFGADFLMLKKHTFPIKSLLIISFKVVSFEQCLNQWKRDFQQLCCPSISYLLFSKDRNMITMCMYKSKVCGWWYSPQKVIFGWLWMTLHLKVWNLDSPQKLAIKLALEVFLKP